MKRNYHPEKLAWAIGFQAVIYALYLAQDVAVQFRRYPANRWESTIRMVVNAALWFTAFYILLEDDYRKWMGQQRLPWGAFTLSSGGCCSGIRDATPWSYFTAVAIAMGFVVLAIPLEADAHWIALGWAGCAAVLWWFGVRVQAAPLRCLAAVIAMASAMRLLCLDLPEYPRELWMPLWNPIALPSLGAVACMLGSILATRSRRTRLHAMEQILVAAASLAVLVLLWLVLSVDVYHHFNMRHQLAERGTIDWRRVAQMSLSVLWTLTLRACWPLVFRWHVAALRWLAIGFYGLTVGKVFLVDMAGLAEIYRIVAFMCWPFSWESRLVSINDWECEAAPAWPRRRNLHANI